MATAVPIAGQLPPRFAGRFELLPLFQGRRPVLKNGHCDYQVGADLHFRTDAGEHLTVFAGTHTDLASIPRLFWWALPPDGPWALAAVFHDEGYASCGTYTGTGRLGRTRRDPYSRAEVDDILRQAMTALGVPAWKRWLIYTAVRMFGDAGWGD